MEKQINNILSQGKQNTTSCAECTTVSADAKESDTNF